MIFYQIDVIIVHVNRKFTIFCGADLTKEYLLHHIWGYMADYLIIMHEYSFGKTATTTGGID